MSATIDATPEELGKRPDESVEEFQERKRAKLRAALDEQLEDRSGDFREKLATIESAVAGDDDNLTETLPFGDHELTVTTRISGRLEQKLQRIDQHRQDLDEVKNALLDAIQLLIVGPEEWADRDVWEAYYLEHGSEGLGNVFELLVEPALQRRERLNESFRKRRRGDAP